MKKYLLMIVAASALLACAKEMAQNELTPVSGDIEGLAEGTPISFTVEVEAASETKATISSSTNFTWESTDRAAVYTSDGSTKIELTPTDISGGAATFTGAVPSGKNVAEGAIVVYPASFLTGPSTVTFPDTYADEGATKGQGTVLAAKVASGRKLNFKYLAATMKAAITDVPSVATSITVESTAVLTGAHTIDFSGTTPSLSTSSTAKTITFSSPSNGNNVLVVPVPTTGSQTFTYKVKYSSSDLFTKSTTQTMARNTYMSMADVAIAPSVHMLSDMTSWDSSNKANMSLSGNNAYITLNAIANQYWRPIVVYPTGYWIFYGFKDTNSDETSGTFDDITAVSSGKMSALVNSSAGNYMLTFNYVTGAYSSSSTGTISGFQIGDSSHGNLQSMTKLSSTLAYNVRQWGNNGGTLYAYFNEDYAASQGGNYYVSSENYYLWLYNFATNTLVASWFDNNTAGNWQYVNLKGSFDGWTDAGVSMTNISGTPAWFINVDWGSETEFGFNAKGSDWGPSWQGNSNDPVTDRISSYCPAVSKVGSNYKVGAGKYTIIFYENNKFAILNRE